MCEVPIARAAQLDLNGDGTLSKSEVLYALRKVCRARPAAQLADAGAYTRRREVTPTQRCACIQGRALAGVTSLTRATHTGDGR